MRRRAFDGSVTAGRQTHPPFEPALRQFEPVDDRRAQFRRIDARSGHDEIVPFDAGVDAIGSTPGKATSTSTTPSVSRTSTGGSQAT